MKYIFFKLILFATALLSLNACQQVIEIDLNQTNPQYVIVGNIADDGKPCVVEIKQTVNFSAGDSYPKISGAVVTLSDNSGNKETLTETKSGVYETKTIKGTIGRTYSLSVTHQGKTFGSSSKMADATPIFDVKFIEDAFGGPPGSGKDTLPIFRAIPLHPDKAGVANFYRYIQTINGVEDKAFLIRNDNLSDGKLNAQPLFSFNAKIHRGDKYNLKLMNIDEATYTYFYSLNQSSGNGPGGGTTPSNPPNNITGGALGYFSAHSVTEITKIVE
jgi:hypothetical protein